MLHALLATLLAASNSAAAVTAPERAHGVAVGASRDTARDRREILRVEAILCRAFESGDVAALRRHLDPGFTLVDSRGTVTGLADTVAELASGEPAYDRFHNHGQDIRLHGDAAIVTGITSIRGRSGGEAFAADFRFTDTWVHRDGAWRMAASHATRLQP